MNGEEGFFTGEKLKAVTGNTLSWQPLKIAEKPEWKGKN